MYDFIAAIHLGHFPSMFSRDCEALWCMHAQQCLFGVVLPCFCAVFSYFKLSKQTVPNFLSFVPSLAVIIDELPKHFVTWIGPLPSVLWHCWLGGRKGIRPVKNWVVVCWRGYLGWGADLHMAQQMPLPLTISCSSKSRLVFTFLVFTFLVPAHPGGLGQIPEEQ